MELEQCSVKLQSIVVTKHKKQMAYHVPVVWFNHTTLYSKALKYIYKSHQK